MNKKFKIVIPYLKERKWNYLLGFLILAIVDGLQLLIPKIIQHVIDGITNHKMDMHTIFYASLLIFVISGTMYFLRYWWRIFIVGNAQYIEKSLRQDYYNHLVTLSQSFFSKTKIGDLMAYATNDLMAVKMLFGMGFVAISDITLLAVSSIIFMAFISPKLTLLSIIPMPFMSIMLVIFGKKMHRRFRKVQKSFSSLTSVVQENISGIRVVKAFNQEDSALGKLSKSAYEYVIQNIKMAKLNGMFEPFLGLIISISMGIVLIYGGILTMKNNISIGQLIAFFSYLGMLAWPMIAVGWFVNLYQRGTASLIRLNKIFETETEIHDTDKTDFSIKKLEGNIEFRHLTFSYDKEHSEIFKDITTAISAGKTLAIVGRTACGKSTLLNLFLRVYNPPENTIFLDGNEIYKVPLKTLHNSMTIVPQDIFLFSDTVAANIKFSNPNADEKEVIEAAKIAQVHKEIIQFSEGYETIVGERGVTLSGGQKQRIAIARALLKNPDILILDDSLSAVDTKTENQILNHLIINRKNKTNILVSHRISSIRHSDKIIVIDQKKIVESGTHSELLEKNGLYRELFEKQQLKNKIEEINE